MPRQRHKIPYIDARVLLPLSRQNISGRALPGVLAALARPGYDLLPLSRQ